MRSLHQIVTELYQIVAEPFQILHAKGAYKMPFLPTVILGVFFTYVFAIVAKLAGYQYEFITYLWISVGIQIVLHFVLTNVIGVGYFFSSDGDKPIIRAIPKIVLYLLAGSALQLIYSNI